MSEPDAPDAVDADTLRRLFTTTPEEFVAARNALVKEMKARGDRAAASAVAALHRPSVVDWTLNVVSVEHPEVIGAYLDAASRVREAQAAAVEGRAGGSVRGPLQTLREHTGRVHVLAEQLLTRSGRAPGSVAGAVTARLAEIGGNPAAAEQLRAGRLGSAAVEAIDPFGGLTPAEQPARGPKASASTGTVSRSGSARADAKSAADIKVDRRRLEAALTTARRDRAAAASKLAKAKARLAASTRAAADAEARADEARARLDVAKRDHAEASEAARRAESMVDDAERALRSNKGR